MSLFDIIGRLTEKNRSSTRIKSSASKRTGAVELLRNPIENYLAGPLVNRRIPGEWPKSLGGPASARLQRGDKKRRTEVYEPLEQAAQCKPEKNHMVDSNDLQLTRGRMRSRETAG
jgi:hypothetical protein